MCIPLNNALLKSVFSFLLYHMEGWGFRVSGVSISTKELLVSPPPAPSPGYCTGECRCGITLASLPHYAAVIAMIVWPIIVWLWFSNIWCAGNWYSTPSYSDNDKLRPKTEKLPPTSVIDVFGLSIQYKKEIILYFSVTLHLYAPFKIKILWFDYEKFPNRKKCIEWA